MKFRFGIEAQRTAETGGTQWWWKRNVLDFQRRKGAGHGEKEIKGCVLTVVARSRQRPAQHPGSILFLLSANSDSVRIRMRSGVRLFKISQAANFCGPLKSQKERCDIVKSKAGHWPHSDFLDVFAIVHRACIAPLLRLFFTSSHGPSTHADPHKFSTSTSPLPSVSASSHTYARLTASPPLHLHRFLLSLSFLCQRGIPIALCNKAFRGWWKRSGLPMACSPPQKDHLLMPVMWRGREVGVAGGCTGWRWVGLR